MRTPLVRLGPRKKVSQSGHQCGRKFKNLQTNLTESPARLTRYTSALLHTGHFPPLLIRWNIIKPLPLPLLLSPQIIHVHVDASVHVIEQIPARMIRIFIDNKVIPTVPAP
jgi:hypothetical protein